jgi:putative DNA primase/helicase
MGRQIIAIDNITHELEGDLLNQSLTQERVDLRILGESRVVTAKCLSVMAANGNNLKVVGDLTRRALIARLDPKAARPELRQFDYDPLIDAKDNRGELIAAALTILKAYHAAGQPGRPPQLQSFADWSDIVRGALIWVGFEDPAATQDRLRENDPQLTTLIRVATVWRKAFNFNPTTVGEAVAKAEEKKRNGTYEDNKFEPVNPDLLDALMALGRRGPTVNPEAVGKYLRSVVDRVVALETGITVRFEKAGTRQGAILWALAAVEAAEDVPFS